MDFCYFICWLNNTWGGGEEISENLLLCEFQLYKPYLCSDEVRVNSNPKKKQTYLKEKKKVNQIEIILRNRKKKKKNAETNQFFVLNYQSFQLRDLLLNVSCVVVLFSNLKRRFGDREEVDKDPNWHFDRVHPVKRKFSNCQHTSSGRPSGTKFNFPRMTSGRPFAAGVSTLLRARTYAYIYIHTYTKGWCVVYVLVSFRTWKRNDLVRRWSARSAMKRLSKQHATGCARSSLRGIFLVSLKLRLICSSCFRMKTLQLNRWQLIAGDQNRTQIIRPFHFELHRNY